MKTKTKSFKTKLWMYFALFTAFIFIVLWLLQTVFLQSLYKEMLISDTKKAAEEIISHSLKPDIEKKIDTAARQNSLLILIADEGGNIIYSSDEFKNGHMKSASEKDIPEPQNDPPEKKLPNENSGNPEKNNYRSLPYDYNDVLKLLADSPDQPVENINDDYYVFGSYISYNGYDDPVVLYISTPIDATGSSVIILKKILALVTIISLIAGFILSWFIAKKFSKPVARLSCKAENLGEADYSTEYENGFCSELDRLSDTMDRTNEKLIVSKEFQMQLLSNVSHDLRTPLTMIKGYAEMIRDISWEDSDAMKEDVQVIIKEADRLNALVNEILEYSELQTADRHKDFEVFDLSAVVKSSADRFEKLLSPENVVIEKNIEPGITVNGDSELLERALYNLMDNAVRHTGNGKNIRVGLTRSSGKAMIEVQDYGKGIPASEIGYIWERYYTARQRKGKGVSGLGLAIVKQIVGIHNGTCFAESREGEGCTFFIELVTCTD